MSFKETQLPRPNETDIRNISGLIQTTTEEPTGRPRNFYQQFRIYDGKFWWYDTIDNAWHSTP